MSDTTGTVRDEAGRDGPGRVLLSAKPHPITIVLRSFTAVVLLIVYAAFLMEPVRRVSGPAVAMWLLWAAVAVAALRAAVETMRWFARRYTLTERVITASDGVLRRWRVEMPLERIQHAVLHQTILERLLGLGTVGVSSAGGSGLEVLWLWIERPRAALQVIEAVRERRTVEGGGVGGASSAVPPTAAPGSRCDDAGMVGGNERTIGTDRAEPWPVARDGGDLGLQAGLDDAAPSVRLAEPRLTPPPHAGEGERPSSGSWIRPAGRPGADRSLVIGLVGGIGAGKSAVARALEELGAAVSDSDKQAKAMLLREDVRRELVSWWGPGVLTPTGEVDRGAVAAIVFKDDQQRRRLERLIHPMLRAGREELKREAWANGIEVVVIDAPLLFEAGIEGECDEVWFVDVPRDMRLARVQASRGWDEAELARREAAQMSEHEKRRRATRVIHNNGDEADLRHFVREGLEAARTDDC